MIDFLETVFAKTMRVYWYSARYTGRNAGINEVKAIIHDEIRVLSSGKGHDSGERIAELKFILAQMQKLTRYDD